MTDHDRFALRLVIAGLLDFPSVYMGGPSHASMSKAIGIIRMLEDSYHIEPTGAEMIELAESISTWRKSPWDGPDRI